MSAWWWISFGVPWHETPAHLSAQLGRRKSRANGGMMLQVDNQLEALLLREAVIPDEPQGNYSGTDKEVVIQTHTGQEGIRLFPNPASAALTVQCAHELQRFAVRDGLGRTVLQGSLSKAQEIIDLSELAAGQYLLSVQEAGGTTHLEPFVKQP